MEPLREMNPNKFLKKEKKCNLDSLYFLAFTPPKERIFYKRIQTKKKGRSSN
jgi:hypothetical protein